MSTKDSKGNSTTKSREKQPRFNNVQFINFPLNDLQRSEIKAFAWAIDDMDDALIHLNEADYKVGFSYDEFSSAYSCFINPKGEKHPNAGFILSGRGSTPHKALKQAYYIHAVLMQGDWTDWKVARQQDQIDD